jgi:beta-N-acetylhexosaminidase
MAGARFTQYRRSGIAVGILFLVLPACSSGSYGSGQTSTTTAPTAITPHTRAVGPTSGGAPTTTQTADALACIAALPVRQRVGQLVMVGVQGDDLVEQREFFAQLGIGGALIEQPEAGITPDGVRAFRDGGVIPMMIAVDEEGGDVQRLRDVVGPIPAPATVPGSATPAAAERMIAEHARKVAALGFTVVFAPVVDVSPTTGNGPIGDRAFSRDPAVVTDFARAYVQGWESAGIMPVLKHFPGHGSATGDTHTRTATVPSLPDLRARDLVPYGALARGRSDVGVMVAHVQVPDFTDGPASLSPAAYDLLRNDIRFRGVAFTDALGMSAVSAVRSAPDAALAAIRAGADVALTTDPGDADAVIDTVSAAVGTSLPADQLDASVLRVLDAKKVNPCSVRRAK